MDIQILEYSPFWNFLEYSRIVWDYSRIIIRELFEFMFYTLEYTLLFKSSDFLIL